MTPLLQSLGKELGHSLCPLIPCSSITATRSFVWRRHRTPATYAYREQVVAGGLISYGASRSGAYRQAGQYVGAFSMVRIPARYRLCCRPSSNWCSISRLPRRSALRCLRISSNSPTR